MSAAPQTRWIKQKVDGFSYNANWFNLANRYFANALAQLDVLRRAANYRARWWVVPDSQDNPVAPFATEFYQCEVADGSYLWGYMFSVQSEIMPDDSVIAGSATDVCVEVVDSCTGIPLFMDYACGGGLSTNGNAKLYPVLLTQPRIILDPGLVNVQISNRTANQVNCQLLLLFAEPCRIIDEETREMQLERMARAGAVTR
jgi:hypothetical protein